MKKIFKTGILFLSVLFVICGVGSSTQAKVVKTKNIVVTKNKTYKIKLKNKKKYKFTSSNKKIATVNKKGVIKGKSAGKCTIKAKRKNKVYRYKVRVVPLIGGCICVRVSGKVSNVEMVGNHKLYTVQDVETSSWLAKWGNIQADGMVVKMRVSEKYEDKTDFAVGDVIEGTFVTLVNQANIDFVSYEGNVAIISLSGLIGSREPAPTPTPTALPIPTSAPGGCLMVRVTGKVGDIDMIDNHYLYTIDNPSFSTKPSIITDDYVVKIKLVDYKTDKGGIVKGDYIVGEWITHIKNINTYNISCEGDTAMIEVNSIYKPKVTPTPAPTATSAPTDSPDSSSESNPTKAQDNAD